jgi:hypothetical protein
MDLRLCEFKAVETDKEQFKFGVADCEAIIQELGSIDWHGILSRKSVDQCTDLFYDVMWSCFGSFVPPHCVQKFPWVTKELNGVKQSCKKDEKKQAAVHN